MRPEKPRYPSPTILFMPTGYPGKVGGLRSRCRPYRKRLRQRSSGFDNPFGSRELVLLIERGLETCPMRRPWIAIVSTLCYLAFGAADLQAQHRSCDSVNGKCASCSQVPQRVGVCIPSLQFLIVDRLSAAGDRWERALVGSSSCRTPAKCSGAAPAHKPEPRCGVEIHSKARHACDSSCDRQCQAPSSRIGSHAKNAPPPPPNQGSISDRVPPAPRNLPPVVSREPSSPQTSPSSSSKAAAPKLLPTPVSEQVVAPKLPDAAAAAPETSQVAPQPGSDGPRPADEKPVPAPPQEPLPDILVDPFIDDIGQDRSMSDSDVVLTSGIEASQTSQTSTDRGAEPKRMTSSQKGMKSTRIVIKRTFDEKVSP